MTIALTPFLKMKICVRETPSEDNILFLHTQGSVGEPTLEGRRSTRPHFDVRVTIGINTELSGHVKSTSRYLMYIYV